MIREIEVTDIFKNNHQCRHILKVGEFEIDIRSDESGISIEILNNDEVVADCSVDHE